MNLIHFDKIHQLHFKAWIASPILIDRAVHLFEGERDAPSKNVIRNIAYKRI